MRTIIASLLFLAAVLGLSGSALALDKENTLYIDLKDGRVVIEMLPKVAPKHVEQIKKLAREGKYDGLVFHRVIDGFMAQTGDPQGTGRGGMGSLLQAEFSRRHFHAARSAWPAPTIRTARRASSSSCSRTRT